MARFVAPLDAVWLWIESETSPTHVVVLQIFRPPAGSGPEYLDNLYAQMTDPTKVKPGFRRRAYRSAATGGQFAWADDNPLDMTAHVQRATLPAPGRVRELLENVGELHSSLMTRERPQWAARLVDGLEDGRFALLTKLHHSMFDGVNMGRHMLSGLSFDPTADDCVAPWIVPAGASDVPAPEEPDTNVGGIARLKQAAGTAGDVLGSLRSLAKMVPATVREREVPFAAPDSIFNSRVGTTRRFAGDAWPLERLKTVAKSTGTSINDVGLAMCGAALRSYLIERDALPEKPLVAGVPVSQSGTDAGAAGQDGNAIGAVLCNLGTDVDDPLDRLRRVNRSMANNKSLMALDPLTTTAISSGNMAGFLLGAVPALPKLPRPAFNLVVSNVPGLRKPLYWNGAELTDYYPSSVVMNGQALNITLLSYKDDIAIGLTADPEVVPHMQRLLVHLDNALADLEKAVEASS